MFGGSKPLHLPINESTKKSLRVLDYIPPYETHKIGVVYVGPGQVTNEIQILQNQYGSSRYREFLNGLGKLIKLSQVDTQKTFLGGLSRDGNDGEFATIWQDDVMQVIFHVATLMPNVLDRDPSCNAKKCHIGNDFVAIVYNNSGEEYDISTIKCQFLYACVVVEPLDHKTNRVIVKAKPILSELIGHTEAKIVSDQNLPILARQWALHSNLASVIFQRMQRQDADPYASNWLERLRNIKRLRNRMSQELGTHQKNPEDNTTNPTTPGSGSRKPFNVDDFTEFV
jgi:tuberous sclerosis protein 2